MEHGVQLGRLFLERMGSSAEEAREVADHLVRSNLAGHDSHGIGVLPGYVRAFKGGHVIANQTLALLSDFGAILHFDARRGFGARMAAEAVRRGIERARALGTCALGLRNSAHMGRIGAYAELCAESNCAFIGFVNVADHEPFQAPYGSREGRLGTNPFCAAVPGGAVPGTAGPAFLLDMATTTIAFNKARLAYEKGLPAPPDALLDAGGNPTTDPTALIEHHAGALTACGKHKGSGLAVLCEALGAVLTGGQRADEPRKGGVSNSMLAVIIDIGRFAEAEDFRSGVSAVSEAITSSAPAAGFAEVLVPGEPERRMRAKRERDGIPLSDQGWQTILAAGHGLGLGEAALDRLAR